LFGKGSGIFGLGFELTLVVVELFIEFLQLADVCICVFEFDRAL
jgi:hypothetical protein